MQEKGFDSVKRTLVSIKKDEPIYFERYMKSSFKPLINKIRHYYGDEKALEFINEVVDDNFDIITKPVVEHALKEYAMFEKGILKYSEKLVYERNQKGLIS